MTQRRGERPARRRGPGPRPRPGGPRGQQDSYALPRDVVADVRSTARTRADEVLRLLGDAVEALERDRAGRAVEAATRAKSLAPRSAAVRETLGLAHYRAGSFREALRELQAYRRMSGRPDQNHLIADCHRALGAPEKAPPLVQEALRARVSPEVKAEAAVVGAAALADLGRFEEALSLLRRLPSSPEVARPYDLRIWYVAGDVLERAGRRDDAAREFRRILEHDPDAFDAAERLARLS
ncbi:MAG TPA: tetratricopeptide repeat protein [Actinomycetota bacterium]|nr:tetratricopeptide repeat protein [Actinomycetota bacterium]